VTVILRNQRLTAVLTLFKREVEMMLKLCVSPKSRKWIFKPASDAPRSGRRWVFHRPQNFCFRDFFEQGTCQDCILVLLHCRVAMRCHNLKCKSTADKPRCKEWLLQLSSNHGIHLNLELANPSIGKVVMSGGVGIQLRCRE
jgi:hypothetical protein